MSQSSLHKIGTTGSTKWAFNSFKDANVKLHLMESSD